MEALQRKLTKLGFDTPVDGVFGTETTRNVRRWEREHGRTVNGRCSMAEAERIKRQSRRLNEEPPAGRAAARRARGAGRHPSGPGGRR